MSLRTRLLLFGYPALELITMYVLALWVGWGWALIIFLAGFPIGIVVMRWAARTGNALGFLGGVLFCIPGVWSDLVGLILCLPRTSAILHGMLDSWAQARVVTLRFPGADFQSGYGRGDVIQGTIVDEPPTPT